MIRLLNLLSIMIVMGLTACTTVKPYDYTAFKESKPRSIVVLPPINNSPEVIASHSLLSHVTYPLAEAGYYVFPVAVVEETFRQNGLSVADEIHDIKTDKLREIFGADAALYIKITQYGTEYKVLFSDTRVSASARLVDLKSGKVIWSGFATASSEENSSSGGGLIGMLITAAIQQAINTSIDKSHDIANITANRLLYPNKVNGILYGPYSPHFDKPSN